MPQPVRSARNRNHRRKGAELLEFTMALLPMLAMMFLLLDVAWAIFVKSTLEYAVRSGVRYGITITGTEATAASSNMTAMVKSTVQSNALGLLGGASGLAYIKVHYYQPPAPNSNGSLTDVSTQTDGNAGLNVMQVSIEGYALPSLVPRIYGWNRAADDTGSSIGAVAADLIEPTQDSPPIGTAP